MNPSERMVPFAIRRRVSTRLFAGRIFYYPETDSTNRVAADLARRGEPEGTLVVTDHQTHGRGRHDHAWYSPEGRDLLFSLLMRPSGDPRSVLPVTLVVSLAVSVALSRALGSDVRVKWPNDLLVGRSKIGGVLAEGSMSGWEEAFLVVGVGVNVNTVASEFAVGIRETAASCRTITGGEHDRAVLLGDVLTTIETYYDRFRVDGFGALAASYEGRLAGLGRTVDFEREGGRSRGTVLGVGGDGALRIAPEDGGEVITLYSETIWIQP